MSDRLEREFKARYVDEKIDDGGDEEGTYVMKRVYDLGGVYMDLFYLDTEGTVSCVEIAER